MNPYLLTATIFTIILALVWFFVSLPRTIYLPNMAEGAAQEDIETRKKKAARVRSRTFVFGIGGTIGLCLATMIVIWVSGPVKKVYAVFNATVTPTLTLTPTASNTPTPRPTRTPTHTPDADANNFLTSLAVTSFPTVTGTPPTATAFKPSGNNTGGSTTIIQTRIVNVVQTQIVIQTRVIYVNVIVTATFTPTLGATDTHTPTASATSSETATPSSTVTPTETPTETPTP